MKGAGLGDFRKTKGGGWVHQNVRLHFIPQPEFFQALWHSQDTLVPSFSPSSSFSSASKACARRQGPMQGCRHRDYPDVGLQVPREGRGGPKRGQNQWAQCGDWHRLSGSDRPQHMHFVFPLWLVSFQRQQRSHRILALHGYKGLHPRQESWPTPALESLWAPAPLALVIGSSVTLKAA